MHPVLVLIEEFGVRALEEMTILFLESATRGNGSRLFDENVLDVKGHTCAGG